MRVEVRAFIPSRDPIGKLLDRQRLPRAGRELVRFGKEAFEYLESYPPEFQDKDIRGLRNSREVGDIRN